MASRRSSQLSYSRARAEYSPARPRLRRDPTAPRRHHSPRWWTAYAGAAGGPGLRGGTFSAAGGESVRLRFRSVRFVRDATASGTGTWRPADGAHRGILLVSAPGQASVRVELSWTQRSRTATARIGAATLALPAH